MAVAIRPARRRRRRRARADRFNTYGHAVWWAIVTLTTVGYGDITPITHAGRIVAVMIMVSGVGVLGVLAGSLASFFRVGSPEEEDPTAVLATEVVALRQQVELLTAQLAVLVPEGAAGAAPDPDERGDGDPAAS
ncbi:MAG: potassium channel family protein [Acidimicrobiales bacterium]